MKTSFAEPSNSYTLILSKEDAIELITRGVLFRPGYTPSTHYHKSNEVTDGEGHNLLYLLPGEKLNGVTIPIQFVSIRIEKGSFE